MKMSFSACRHCHCSSRAGAVYGRIILEFYEHIVVIILIKIIYKSSILSFEKSNLCSCRHKIIARLGGPTWG